VGLEVKNQRARRAPCDRRCVHSLLRRAGFTLIELLIVILVIAILLAVAAPSFFGQSAKAQDSAAKQYLVLAYKSAKASSLENSPQGGWGDPGNLSEDAFDSEPELSFSPTDSYPATQSTDGLPNVNMFVRGSALELRGLSASGNGCLLTAPENGALAVSCGDLSSTSPPQLLEDPDIDGASEAAGDTLTVDPGIWSAGATVTYQWQRDPARTWNDIAGATSTGYTLTPTDVGHDFRVRVTATNANGSSTFFVSEIWKRKRHPKPKPPKPPIPLTTPTLVAYWRLGDTGTTAVDAKGGHNGTYSCVGASCTLPTRGVAAPKASSTDKAVSFAQQTANANYRAQYVDVPYSAAFGAPSFSLELWVKPAAASMGRQAYLISHFDTSYPASGFYLFKDVDDSLGLAIANGSGGSLAFYTPSSSPLAVGTWYDVVATFDGAGHTGQIYVNGQPAASRDFLSGFNYLPAVSGTPLRLASRSDSSSGIILAPSGLDGTLDEVAYYNGVLDQATITAHYNAYKP
jgi:prepilin-type N-terminal cleavage/methylation domain-containing protein